MGLINKLIFTKVAITKWGGRGVGAIFEVTRPFGQEP